jgi:hypothetical protein
VASATAGCGTCREVSDVLILAGKYDKMLTSNPGTTDPDTFVADIHKSCALRPVVTSLEASIDSLGVTPIVPERISRETHSAFDFPDRPEGICKVSSAIAIFITVGVDAPSVC